MVNFSVLISIYKNTKYFEFKKTLNSIYNQTLLPNELVIIVDGYITFDLYKLISLYVQKNIDVKIIKNNANIQLGLSLCKGVKICKSPLIIRVDSDDINSKSRFKTLINYYKKNKSADVIGSYLLEKYNGSKNKYFLKKVPLNHKDIIRFFNFRNSINHPTVLFKKKTIIKAGNYEKMDFFEDYLMWLKVKSIGGKFVNIPHSLVSSNFNKNYITRRHGKKYFLHYLNFIKIIYKKKLINKFFIFLNFFIRLFLINSPLRFKIFFYKNFLRKTI